MMSDRGRSCRVFVGGFALLFVVVSTTTPVAGQTANSTTTLKHLSLEELSRLIVTSPDKDPGPISRTPAAIYVLTAEDLARSGATSLPDALRLVPGVDVARIDTSRNWVVGIRGFGDQFSKSVLVLIDGRAAYTPLWAGVHWPIQDTLLEDVERIEVIRGPGGTIWGANAQNGVINIITKSAGETKGAYVSALIGTTDRAMAGFRFGGDAGPVDYRVYAKGVRREPQFHTDGRDYDTWKSGQAGFRMDWRHNARDTFTLQGDIYKAELGESVEVSTFNPPARFLVDDPVALSGGNLRGRWLRSLGADSDVSVQFYFDHTDRLGTDFGERRSTFDVDAVHRWRPARAHEITWGLGARTSPGTVTQTLAFSDFQPHEQTLNVLSAYAQDAFELVPRRLTVTGGLKLEQNTYTGLEVQPSVRALWTPGAGQTIWGSVTRAVRTPSRVDEDISVTMLAATTPLIYAVIQGNRALEAETVLGGEVGYRALLRPSVYADVSVFSNKYDHLVDLTAASIEPRVTEGTSYTAFVFPWINGIEGVTRGVELAPRWQVSSGVRLSGSYSFLDIALDPKPGNTLQLTLPMLAGSSPRHHVVIQPLLSVGRGIEVDPVYRYVSGRPAGGIDAYHAADVRVRVPLGRGFDVSVVGQNLFDAHHAEWARVPGPTVEIRRSAYARLTWRR